MIDMMSRASVESVSSLEFSERLEQGVVEQIGVLELRDMAEPRQQCQRRLRQQRLQIAGLLDRGHRILVAPPDRDGLLQPSIAAAVGTCSAAGGSREITQPFR